MSIPPLLSSTPPPLDENQSVVDNDDDFGDFHDYASVGAVSSSTSIPDSAAVFRPLETVEPSSGGFASFDLGPKSRSLQEDNEWSDFDNAVIQPFAEPTQTIDSDNCTNGRLTVGESSENNLGDSAVSTLREENTDGPETISLSTSHLSVSESENSEVPYTYCDSYSSEQIQCNTENSNCKEHPVQADVGKIDDSCSSSFESGDDMYEDTNLHFSGKGIKHPAEVEEDESVHPEEQCDVDTDVVEDDVENCDSFPSSLPAIDSDNNSRSDSDENDFVGDFQSFSICMEMREHTAVEETQSLNSDVEAATEVPVSSEGQEPSFVGSLEVVTVLSEEDTAMCMVSDPNTDENQDEITAADHQSSREHMITSDTAVDDDFDDFEEFVAAPESNAGQGPVVDLGTYEWGAFGNSADDGDDWAAFQDSDQHISTSATSEVSESSAHGQKPAVAYSGCLSKDSLSQSLHACFQPYVASEPDPPSTVTPLHCSFNSTDTGHVSGSKTSSKDAEDGLALWRGLRVMESTPALKYQWQQSHCNNLLLHAINVDARNILNPARKSTAPVFAANIGLLEPKKAIPDQFGSASADSAALNFPSFSERPGPRLQLVSHRRPAWHRRTNVLRLKCNPDDMKNPGRQKHSEVAGLGRPVKKPEKELLEVLELPDCGASQSTKSRSSPLDSILKAISSTSTTSSPSLGSAAAVKDGVAEPLSAEASAVLARLPDLSFMHSKVLMFPVSDCAN